MKIFFPLFGGLIVSAGLSMAQFVPNATCAQSGTCTIVQRSNNQVFTENAPDVCIFTLIDVDQLNVYCKHNGVVGENATVNFLIGQCKSNNFLGAADISWKFCRMSDTVFSWEVADDTTYVRSGTLF